MVLIPPATLAFRPLQDHEKEAIRLATEQAEVDLAGDGDSPAGFRRGDEDRELV